MRIVGRTGPAWRRRTAARAAVALATGVAGVALLPPTPAAAAEPTVVSLAFNDGLSSQYRNAAPLLEQHGMDGTFYVASNWIKTNDARYMRFYHLDELYRQGNEIGGMGKDHRDLTSTYDTDPAADLAYKRDQVCGDFQALTDWGYHPASFSYPGGATNAQAQEIVRGCGFLTGRLPGGLSASGPVYAEPVPPAQPFALRSASTPAGPLTLQTLQNAVTAAGATTGGWLPIGFNHVCAPSDADYSTCMGTPKAIDAEVLDDFLTWLEGQESEGITVATVGEVMGASHPELEPRPFAVTLTFDDGLRSQFALREIFARHGVHGTFYINSGPVDAGEAGTMSWDQIRALEAAGHDIGGHTRDHINLLATDTTYDYKWAQTCEDRARLFEEGLNPVSFAFPFGAMNADASALVRGCGYQSARKAGTVTSDGPIYSETIPVTENPWAIRILGTNYNGPVTLDALTYAVNQARKYGGSWLPTLYHQICYSGTPTFDSCMAGYRPVSDIVIDQFLGWVGGLADQNVSVRTIADVMGGGATAPKVAVTSPEGGDTVAAQPVLTGTASGSGPVSVAIYSGPYSLGAPVTTLTASVSGGTWSAEAGAALPDGTYTAQASQVDGTTGTSVPVTFTVDATAGPSDTTAPEPTVTAPAAGSSVDTATPTIAGTAGTAEGDDSTLDVRVFEGSVATDTPSQTISAAVGTDGTWSVQADALADGTYTVDAVQADATGNVGTSAPVTFTVDTTPVDITAPEVSITAPEDGATVDTATPTVQGTAGTATGDDDQVTVTFSPASEAEGDAVVTMTADVGADGSWSVTPVDLADGTWTLQATQADTAGNIGTSAPVTFTIATTSTSPDTTAPAVAVTSPAGGSSVGTATPTIDGTAGTAEGDDESVSVLVFSGSTAEGSPGQTLSAAVNPDGSWSAVPAALSDGTWTVQARQADTAGNVGTSTAVTFTVDTSVSPPPDTTAPAVAVTAPADGGSVSTATPTIQGTAGTAQGDESTVSVRIYSGGSADGAPAQTLSAPVGSSGSWSAVPAALADGTWTVQARQADTAGNVGVSEAVAFTVDTTSSPPPPPPPPPADTTAPVVSITSPGADATVESSELSVEGTAGTEAGDAGSVTLDVHAGTSVDGTADASVTASVSSGAWSATVTGLSPGTYTLLATQVDTAGNRGTSEPVTITLVTPLEVTGVSPSRIGRGATAVTMRVLGTGFDDDATVSFSGRGVTSTVTGRTSTTVTVQVSVADDAPIGRRDVTVTNGDGGTDTCEDCLKIDRAPRVTSVTPARLEAGSRQRVLLRGANFTRRTTVSLSGRGIEVLRTKKRSATRLVVVLKIRAKAPRTERSLTVTNRRTRGTCYLYDAFKVVP